MSNTLLLKDKVEVIDRLATPEEFKKYSGGAGPKKTKITLINHNTGETIGTYENKCVITGGIMNAAYAFNVEPPIILPSYNDEMNFDHDHSSRQQPMNMPAVCLFGVGDTGCGPTPKDVYVAKYVDRIIPGPATADDASDFNTTMLMPFRFVDTDKDLNDDLRKYYFGRKTFEKLGKIAYYFKTFDTQPQMHLRYADATQITEDMYSSTTEQMAECYIETRLRITKLDFRDYFDQILGWENARISTISLCYAWYDDTIDDYKYYQDIYPYTKLNFAYQWLVDENYALDVIYQIYY